MSDIVDRLADVMDRDRISDAQEEIVNLRKEIERLNTVMANARDELVRLRKENDTLKEIAFDLAMVDENHRTEHDDLLMEDAMERVQQWYEEYKNA